MARPRVFVSCGFMPEQDVLELAPVIERCGYDGITLPDHLFMAYTKPGAYPYTPDGQPPFPLDTPWPDVFALASAVARGTTSLHVTTSVFVLPLRHPLIVAKAAATAAIVSGGRFTLGVGVGWQRAEFEALGVDYERRGAIANEAIEVLRKAWKAGPVEHHGRFFSFGPLLMEPVPPRVPVLIGGSSDAALRRAARLGDGYFAPMMPLDELPPIVDKLRGLLREADRDGGRFELVVPAPVTTAEELERALALEPDTIVVLPWRAAGPAATTAAEKIEHIERFAAEVLGPYGIATA